MLLLWIVCASWTNKRQWYKQPFTIVCVKAERFVLRLKSSFSAEQCWHGWYYHLRKLKNRTASKHSCIPLRWRGSQLHSGLFLLEQPKCQHTAYLWLTTALFLYTLHVSFYISRVQQEKLVLQVHLGLQARRYEHQELKEKTSNLIAKLLHIFSVDSLY